jgi:hypothetical protein
MITMKTDSVIEVLTWWSVDQLVEEGGSGNWVVDRVKARKCEFLVCCRNAHHKETAGPEPHGSAFLIGRISDVVASPRPNRWIVKFDEYALVNIKDVWQRYGRSRNPTRYTDLQTLGIDVSKLEFRPVPKGGKETGFEEPGQAAEGTRGLSIAEAKCGLSITFGVPPEAIEITIRG